MCVCVWVRATLLITGRGAGASGAGVCHPVTDHRGSQAPCQRPPRQQQEAEEAAQDLLSQRAEEAPGN